MHRSSESVAALASALAKAQAELRDEVAGEILGLDLAPFFAPQPYQGSFIAAHDDPGVRAADEKPSSLGRCSPHVRFHSFLRP